MKPDLWKMGKISISGIAGLSPMASFTTLPFRVLAKEYGSAWNCTELVSTKAITRNLNERTKELLRYSEQERPVGLQLFGSDPIEFSKSVELVGEPFDFIDLNCGCSVPKILSQESGAFLIKHPKKLQGIIAAIQKVTDKPITIKTRSGWDEKNNAVEVAKAVEDAGAAGITIHARSVKQLFSGNADWKVIKQVKEKVNIPVIGNGDVKSWSDAFRMKEETNCDAVLIGRGAMGNAFIFQQIQNQINGKKVIERTLKDREIEFGRFLALCQTNPIPLLEVKMMANYYSRALPNSTYFREQLQKAPNVEAIQFLFFELLGVTNLETNSSLNSE